MRLFDFMKQNTFRKWEPKEVIQSFDLIYKDESNYVADAYASDINWYMKKVPEHEKQILQRLNQHLLRIRK